MSLYDVKKKRHWATSLISTNGAVFDTFVALCGAVEMMGDWKGIIPDHCIMQEDVNQLSMIRDRAVLVVRNRPKSAQHKTMVILDMCSDEFMSDPVVVDLQESWRKYGLSVVVIAK